MSQAPPIPQSESFTSSQPVGLASPSSSVRPTVIVVSTDSNAASVVGELLGGLACEVSMVDNVQSVAVAQHAPVNGSLASDEELDRFPSCVILAGPLSAGLADDRINEVRAALPGVPVVVAWEPVSVAEAILAMRGGADSILVLSQPRNQLVDSLNQIIDQGQQLTSRNNKLRHLIQRLATLTEAEEQVLEAMLAGMANKQIAQHLQIGLRTVELRRSKIMRKMEAKSLAELIKFVCVARNADPTKPDLIGSDHVAD